MLRSIIITVLLIFVSVQNAVAFSTIRDDEIEGIIKELATPIFKAAELEPKSIKIYIVNSDDLNAFVAGGQNIFLTTGILTFSKSPETIMGVIAHECGHIVGGHYLARKEEMKNMKKKMAFNVLLGIAAGMAAESSGAGMGAASAASHANMLHFLEFTRAQESAADHAGLKYLKKIGVSSNGLLKLLKELGSNERMFYSDMNPYLRTHPLSRERVSYIANFAANHNHISNPALAPDLKNRFQLATIKLRAFLNPADKTLREYSDSKSHAAKYARAIAYFKKPNLDKAIKEIDSLITTAPKNPYYHELKGQFYFENGKVRKAIPHYHKALQLLPDSTLLKLELARSYIAAKQNLKSAITLLEQVVDMEDENAAAWHQLGIAYSKFGDEDNSKLALAKRSLITGDLALAKRMVKTVENHINENSDKKLTLRLGDLKKALAKS